MFPVQQGLLHCAREAFPKATDLKILPVLSPLEGLEETKLKPKAKLRQLLLKGPPDVLRRAFARSKGGEGSPLRHNALVTVSVARALHMRICAALALRVLYGMLRKYGSCH